MWRKGYPFTLLVGMQTGTATVESSTEKPQKIENGSAFQPSYPTSGNISEGTQNTNSKEYRYPCVHCSIICSCQDVEAARVSISRWVDKTTMAHLHNGILLGQKKKEYFTLCNSMYAPGEHYVKWNMPGRERQIPYDLTRMWNLMKKLT